METFLNYNTRWLRTDGQPYECRVIDRESPGEFYVHLVEEDRRRQRMLRRIYTTPRSHEEVYALVEEEGFPGKPVLFYNREDEEKGFYRGTILEILRTGTYSVWFGDYGHEEEVTLDDLYTVPEWMLGEPYTAIRCGLQGHGPYSGGEWKDEEKAHFRQLTHPHKVGTLDLYIDREDSEVAGIWVELHGTSNGIGYEVAEQLRLYKHARRTEGREALQNNLAEGWGKSPQQVRREYGRRCQGDEAEGRDPRNIRGIPSHYDEDDEDDELGSMTSSMLEEWGRVPLTDDDAIVDPPSADERRFLEGWGVIARDDNDEDDDSDNDSDDDRRSL